MRTGDGRASPTPMGDQGDAKALRRDRVAADTRGDGALLPGPLHPLGAGGDGPSLGGGAPAGAGAAVPGDRRADGVVDCGITGIDLVRERAADVHQALALGFGSCRLEVAVPQESEAQSLEDLEGSLVATVYPRLTRELLPVDVRLVDVTGSVEIA